MAWLMAAMFVASGCGGAEANARGSLGASNAFAGPTDLYNGQPQVAEQVVALAGAEDDEVGSGDAGPALMSKDEARADAPSPTPEQQAMAERRRKAKQRGDVQPPKERKFVRNASLTLEVKDDDDFEPTLEEAGKIAKSLDGYVQAETSTSMTMLVPTERLDDAMERLEKLGKVEYRDVRVVDVTAKFFDLQIRIDNLKRLRERLTDLIGETNDVKQILEIERELSRVTTELERLEGQMRLLGQQTTYATIRISLTERVRPGPLGWVFYGIGLGIKWLFVWD